MQECAKQFYIEYPQNQLFDMEYNANLLMCPYSLQMSHMIPPCKFSLSLVIG